MAFITGVATTIAGLRQAIIDGCVANGWSNSGNVIWKGSSYFELTTTSTEVILYGGTGQSGGVITGKAPTGVKIGGSYITFPVSYDLHVFDNPDEVYFVVSYNVDYYQQLSFGTSNVAGAGNGPWFTGAHATTYSILNNGMNIENAFYAIYAYPFANISNNALGLFLLGTWSGEVGSSFVYTNLGGTTGWYGFGSGASTKRLLNGSATHVAGLLNCSPSAFNGISALLPIKAMIDMGSFGRATVASLNNARFCRIDNSLPGGVISYGTERWKVYPWLRKNTAARNGVNNSTSTPPNHSGTFGYAIRYTGP